jgi:hypothetical protein
MKHDPLSTAFTVESFNRMVDSADPKDLPQVLKQLFLLHTNTVVLYRELLENEIIRNCEVNFNQFLGNDAQSEDLS